MRECALFDNNGLTIINFNGEVLAFKIEDTAAQVLIQQIRSDDTSFVTYVKCPDEIYDKLKSLGTQP